METIKTFVTLSKKLNYYKDISNGLFKIFCTIYCDSLLLRIQIENSDEVFINFTAGKPSLYDALYLISCTYKFSFS